MGQPSFPSDAADKFVVRLPAGLREKIAAAAKLNNRSMNAEFVSRIEASLEQDEAAGGMPSELTQQIEAALLRFFHGRPGADFTPPPAPHPLLDPSYGSAVDSVDRHERVMAIAKAAELRHPHQPYVKKKDRPKKP